MMIVTYELRLDAEVIALGDTGAMIEGRVTGFSSSQFSGKPRQVYVCITDKAGRSYAVPPECVFPIAGEG
jgi:hypothetical protein